MEEAPLRHPMEENPPEGTRSEERKPKEPQQGTKITFGAPHDPLRSGVQGDMDVEMMVNTDVICLQEHRIHHTETLMQEMIGAYLLVTASAEKNNINAKIRSVGFLLSPRAQKACHSINKISERIVVLTLLGNPQTTVICCYSPTTDDTETIYKAPSSTVASVPAHNMLIIGRNFNAQLGPNKAKFTYHKDTNKNDQLLTDFMEQSNLIAANTWFQNRPNRLWTHRSPRGYLSQLDYILVRRKWQNSTKNYRAYTSFTSVGSDHKSFWYF